MKFELEFTLDGSKYGIPRVCSGWAEGEADIVNVQRSFSHEYGVQSFESSYVDNVECNVALEDEDGEIVAEYSYEDLESSKDGLKVDLLKIINGYLDDFDTQSSSSKVVIS